MRPDSLPFFVFMFFLVSSAQAQPIPLFNGRDLSGWQVTAGIHLAF